MMDVPPLGGKVSVTGTEKKHRKFGASHGDLKEALTWPVLVE